ncbi:DUF4234 domain-containing protein [Marinobacterium mangrovicola]|uniref:Uncharacterized protein DUF4234 n=1 Tax=Marinobacterium mangrovicola TaxID=1476959 RepID=A0A4R1G9E4_9GAMM|nr:DUF4234 domain-containing protein [Marinobacterium mangrovicola]TCK04817.1 uncharacterized protein DUF4234 [Marinobacterium mangrovicola]
MTQVAENPYAAPEADLEVQQNAGDLSVFNRFSTWWVFLLSIVTIGIYPLFWIHGRTRKLNSISEHEKVPTGLVTTYIVVSLAALILPTLFGFVLASGAGSMGALTAINIFGNLLSLTGFILLEVWAFKFRGVLNRVTQSEGKRTWAGGVMTFFFTMLYMNYKINQHIDSRR